MQMKGDRSDAIGYLLAGFVGSLLVLWLLSHAFRVKDPNLELAEAAREAVKLANSARKDAEAVRRSSSALRLVALVTGTTVPLVVAYLVYRLQSRQEPTIAEVLRVLEEQKLIDLDRGQRRELPPPTSRVLEGQQKEADGEAE